MFHAWLVAVVLLLQPALAHSAPTNFYTLGERWEREMASGKTRKEAMEESFKSSLSDLGLQAVPSPAPAPPPKRLVLREIVQSQQIVQIQLNQSLYIEAAGILKFVPNDEGLVTMEKVDPNTLAVVGVGIGRTFLHIWDSAGRNTFELHVTQPVYLPSAQESRALEGLDKSRSFRLGYNVNHSALYTGDKGRTLTRSSYDHNQNFSLEGDSPYGAVTGSLATRKSRGKTIITQGSLALKDGRVGPWRNFDLTLADARIQSGFMVFPQARVRGARVDKWDDAKRLKWTSFYGREQVGIIGAISPGLVNKRTTDSFLGGGYFDFKASENLGLRGGYFGGQGQSRADDLNKKGVALGGDVGLGPHVRFQPEMGHDMERFVQKHATKLSFKKLTLSGTFRNIEKDFRTLTGNPAGEGEVGMLFDFQAKPFLWLDGTASWNVFRDKLLPNPLEPDAFNQRRDAQVNIYRWDNSSVILGYQDFDESGRLGPTRQRGYDAQWNYRLRFLQHWFSFFERYQYRRNASLINSNSNYNRDQLLTGIQTELFWGINLSVQKEWNHLREPTIGRTTHPEILTATFDYSSQLGDTPFFLDLRLRLRDEEETESRNSFLSGEDSTEIAAGLYYRGLDNLELYLTGRLENFVPESLDIAAPRVEASFFTGMNYLFDTGLRWMATGNFEGFVFKDLNQDGTRQPGELGLPGIPVRLGDGRQGATDARGFYKFTSVTGKKAVLELDVAKLPYGYAATGGVRRELMIENLKTQRVDFGAAPRADITGIVFHDLNKSGKYEISDIGIPQAKVLLETGRATRTNRLGVYTFINEVAGERQVALDTLSLPEGYLPVGSARKKITLYEGIRYQQDFPVTASRLVSGRVFVDKNGNEVLDEGEESLKGIKVLFGSASITTDEEGWYLFENMDPGDYELSVDFSSLPRGLEAPSFKIKVSLKPMTLERNIPVGKPKAKAPKTENQAVTV